MTPPRAVMDKEAFRPNSYFLCTFPLAMQRAPGSWRLCTGNPAVGRACFQCKARARVPWYPLPLANNEAMGVRPPNPLWGAFWKDPRQHFPILASNIGKESVRTPALFRRLLLDFPETLFGSIRFCSRTRWKSFNSSLWQRSVTGLNLRTYSRKSLAV